MNERIKELADQIWSLDVEPNPYFQLCLQAFAELILKQCLTYVDDSFGDVDYVKFMIKRDFGVEE